MKYSSLMIVLASLLMTNIAFGQVPQIPVDSIESKFLKGHIILIDDWAVLGPENFFDSLFLSDYQYEFNQIDTATSRIEFGYFGETAEIYNLNISELDSISYGFLLDKQIIKYLNPTKPIFYFINGGPCYSFDNAISLLANRKITKIELLSKAQATAIWGERDGKNGAIMINTEKKPEVLFIFK